MLKVLAKPPKVVEQMEEVVVVMATNVRHIASLACGFPMPLQGCIVRKGIITKQDPTRGYNLTHIFR